MLKHSNNKIAFLHIPKTAGVSIINAFSHQFGAESCESFISEISENSFHGKRFVAGHVYLGDILCDAFIFTFVRNPLDQIASHLMWIDHYTEPQYELELNAFPEKTRQEIRELASVDLASAKSIDRYFQKRTHDSALRLVNLQSELLAFNRGGVTEMAHIELANKAIENINRLGFVGISENVQTEIATLFKILDLKSNPIISHLNRSPSSRKVDITLPDIRRTLMKYVQADLRLYDYLIAKKENDPVTKPNFFSMMRSLAKKYAR